MQAPVLHDHADMHISLFPHVTAVTLSYNTLESSMYAPLARICSTAGLSHSSFGAPSEDQDVILAKDLDG